MASKLSICEYIETLNEDRLRRLIYGFFLQENLTYITHGVLESGADIILILKQNKDVLQRGQVFYFQVKAGKINTAVWRNSLHSQLLELYNRPLNLASPINDDNVSRRIILVTNSSINQDVISKIQNHNRKHYLPIECLIGMEFSAMLGEKGLSIDSIAELSNIRYPGE